MNLLMQWRRFNNRLRLSIRASNLVSELRANEDNVLQSSRCVL